MKKGTTQKNRGITIIILSFLDKKNAAFTHEIYDHAKSSFPTVTRSQIGSMLADLKKRGKILHISPRAYGCVEYPYR
jgi:hypothetical protein